MGVVYCWPTRWLEAAQRSGLATRGPGGRWVFIHDGLDRLLADFAEDIVAMEVMHERNECSEIVEKSTANTRFQSVDHYVFSRYILGKILDRNTEDDTPR